VTFPRRLLLAPMEGITDQVFRDCIIDTGGVGGACTEFVRISSSALPPKVIRRSLGEPRTDVPVGVQLMAADADFLVPTIRSAERCGAPWIDLNFGCPAPVVFSKCAGSAMLAKPEAMAEIIRIAVAATGLPVSAKMRAGITDPGRLLEILQAVAEAGAAMITLHARLRIHGYHQPAHWQWIAEAKRFLGDRVPLVGNGAVDVPEDVERMRAETGCDAVMIGRAALANPWIFACAAGAPAPTASQAAGFALTYAKAILAHREPHVCLNKLKQMTKHYRAGGLFDGREEERMALLRATTLDEVLGWYQACP
jgi:tRNA-dihydrouridine synthase C